MTPNQALHTALLVMFPGLVQGRRKHLKLGGARHFEGTSFLRKRGNFLETKRALLFYCKILVGQVPPELPVPTSISLCSRPLVKKGKCLIFRFKWSGTQVNVYGLIRVSLSFNQSNEIKFFSPQRYLLSAFLSQSTNKGK